MNLNIYFGGLSYREIALDPKSTFQQLIETFFKNSGVGAHEVILRSNENEISLNSELSILESEAVIYIQPSLSKRRRQDDNSLIQVTLFLEDGKKLCGDFLCRLNVWTILEKIEKQHNINLTRRIDEENSPETFYIMPVIRVQDIELDNHEKLMNSTLSMLDHRHDKIILRLYYKPTNLTILEIEDIIKNIEINLLKEDQLNDKQNEFVEQKNHQENEKDPFDSPPKTFDHIMGRIDRLIAFLCQIDCSKQLQNVLSVLTKITLNLSKYPVDPKHKILHLNNKILQERVFCFENAIHYLECLGFSKDPSGETLIYNDEIADENVAIRALDMLKHAQINVSSVKRLTSDSSIENNEIPIIDRKMKVFHADFLRQFRVKSVNLDFDSKDSSDENDSISKEDGLLIRKGFADDKRYAMGLNPGVLVSHEKLESMRIRRKYEIVIIRVHFPSKIVIEARFDPRETVGDIMKFI